MSVFNDYWNLLREQGRFLAFGFLMTFASGAGQTYFIGIFGPSIQQHFALSHTQWSSIYMLGTLASAALLPWSGQLIDRLALDKFTAATLLGLAFACLMLSLSPTILALIAAIFLLRQFGQGLSSHVAQTSMARYMGKNRGKALAIASVGFSAGEAILPVSAVLVVSAIGWQATYQLAAVGVLILLPIILLTLNGQRRRHFAFLRAQVRAENSATSGGIVSKTRHQMLRESRFYLLLIAVLMPSYIATAQFFYHLTLAEAKGWSSLWITGNYWVYALATVITSLVSGPLIDKYTAVKIMPYYLAPLVAALLILIPAQHPFWVLPYMVLLGVNIGIFFTAIPALWAELYGAKYLGGIKSVIGAFSVFASALGPITIGLLLDAAYSIEQVMAVFIVLCLVATVLLVLGLRRYQCA